MASAANEIDYCRSSLRKIYKWYLASGNSRAAIVERYLSSAPNTASTDGDTESDIATDFEAAFSSGCRSVIERLFKESTAALSGVPFERSGDALSALSFLQWAIAAALWKYRIEVGHDLERFAREFDRLDTLAEQKRLYAQSQRG